VKRELSIETSSGLMLGLVFSLLSVSSIAGLAQASSTASSAYDPRVTFAPLALPDPVNAYRSSNGARGRTTGKMRLTMSCMRRSIRWRSG
jgi:hypothetical protein